MKTYWLATSFDAVYLLRYIPQINLNHTVTKNGLDSPASASQIGEFLLVPETSQNCVPAKHTFYQLSLVPSSSFSYFPILLTLVGVSDPLIPRGSGFL